ncbi:50S ribosomal protein L9 [Aestuariivirga litoralis]|uniref:50S ribosomal protein L9 n=1 Tax=Aestuariivirga litoralis TaxID=2650924 RepID=UPI0018C63CDD|nr:50S ribosomal protein L9 [Aestuariivirga litoralis]
MQVILLERVGRLGHMGEVVKVKDGYARNFLLPNHKALRATEANKAKFERDRAVLEAKNADARKAAETEAKSLDGKIFVIIRQAGEGGHLYGSVSPRDIAEAAAAQGATINKNHVHLGAPIKSIGLHTVEVAPHPEVTIKVQVNVARSPDEAAAQARGEDLSDGAAEKAETRAAAEALFAEAQADERAEEDAEPGIETAAERKAKRSKKAE